MKVTVATLALAVLLPLSAYAQEQITVKHSCSYIGELPDEQLWSFASDTQAQDAVTRVMNFTGLPQNFDIMAANVPNAAAVIRGERRLILYNQGFMERVANATSNDWAAMSIMAHEIGHHLSGHTLEAGGSRPKIELEADRFSGYVLQRMGATLDDAQIAMRTLAGDQGSDTHPAKSARLTAIENGFFAAREQGGGGTARRESPVTTNTRPPVSNPSSSGTSGCPSGRSGASTTYAGQLSSGDNTLDNGEYYDVCDITFSQGERIAIDLTSSDFDTHLFLVAPNGDIEQNDDYEGSTQRSRIEMEAPVDGTYRIGVTSYAAKEVGNYQVAFTATSNAQSGSETIQGSLAAGDATISSGEYADSYTINVSAGQRIVADVTSTAFDTYLMVRDPNGEKTDNDDFEGSSNRSRVELTATVSGEWRVLVTSYKTGEQGAYTLSLSPGPNSGTGGGKGGGTTSGPISGTLDKGDETLDNGEYYDVYYVNVDRNDRVRVEMTSNDIDTYLVALSSSGDKQENDDHEGSKNTSFLDFTASETGQWRIFATSYEGNERGAYNLSITPNAIQQAPSSQTFTGSLSSGDRTLGDGEYYDTYYISTRAGQRVTLELTSTDFDTYLVASDPGDDKNENDDYEGSKNTSRLELNASSAGQWTITVTSYKGGESGNYRLNVNVQ